jgi:hypothetical protein
MWCPSRGWPRKVDKNSLASIYQEQRERLRRFIKHKEWTGWTAGTLGKSAAKSPAVAHLHECSPPRTSSLEDIDPSCHHVAGERCLSFASKHLTCLIWSNHPAVNLLRAIRLFYPLSFILSNSVIHCHSRTLFGIPVYRYTCSSIYT